jgi:glycine/D-amino acid oxidase-like deaminating enzyme
MGQMSISRRAVLAWLATAAAGTWLLGRWWQSRPAAPPLGTLQTPDHALAHRLRTGDFPPPARTEDVPILIVGGGIAGLSAARHLARAGRTDFLLLELEDHLGGNAAYARNAHSAYPLGAHYLPVANLDDHDLLDFLKEIKVVTGHDAASGLPIYDEFALCASPQERLFIHSQWQEGIVPQYGVPAADTDQIRRFLAEMQRLRTLRGRDGRYLFDLPSVRSSTDAEWLALRQRPFAEWLDAEGYTSQYLRWYLDYCCRDDFGAGIATVCAWAGLHYFAARRGQAANATHDDVLTWPEGNGFLMEKLAAYAHNRFKTRQLAYQVRETTSHVEVHVFDATTSQSVAYRAQRVVLATPFFVSERLLGRPTDLARHYDYFPWLVANLTTSEPLVGSGTELAWDNVLYAADGLGYIHAQHQQVGRSEGPQVYTYYRPLPGATALEARQVARNTSGLDFKTLVLNDLRVAHPDIGQRVQQIDLHLWAHAMICPTPAFFAHPPPDRWGRRVALAHSDLGGMSLFEEAFGRGVAAARWCVGGFLQGQSAR